MLKYAQAGALLVVGLVMVPPSGQGQGLNDLPAYCDPDDTQLLSAGLASAPGSEWWRKVALEVEGSRCRARHDLSGKLPWSLVTRVDGRVLYADSSASMSDATRVRASAAYSLSIYKPDTKLPSGASLDADLPDDGWDWGFLDAGVEVGFDADSNWDERLASYGLSAEWEFGWSSWWRMMLPTVGVDWERVHPLESAARAAVGVDPGDDVHSRMTVHARTNARLGPFGLVLKAARHRTSGLSEALAETGWEKGDYLEVEASYTLPTTEDPGFIRFEGVHLRLTTGRLPTADRNRTTLSFGAGIGVG